MQKNHIIAIVAVVLIGGGAFFFLQNKKEPTQSSVVTSIKDALSKQVSMECVYTDEEGRESKFYMKNGAIRSDYQGTEQNQSGSVIVTAKKMYMWQGKDGFMMDIPEETEATAKDTSVGRGVSQRDEVMANLEKYKESCKPAVVSDGLFTPPSDVNFQDYSQMMQQIPSAGAGMSEEKVKEYMQQYSNP